MPRLDYADFLPLFEGETEDVIRARVNAWANEGLAGGDPRIVDTREGSFFQIMTEGGVRNSAMIYDRFSELLGMSNPLIAGGYYLDLIATGRGTPRLAAVPATGSVTFSGAAGTAIPQGTPVTAPSPVVGDPAITFTTDSAVVVGGDGTVAAAITASVAGSGSNVAIGAINSTTIGGLTVTNAAPISNGADIESDDVLARRIIESFQARGANVATIKGWALAHAGVGLVTVLANAYGLGTVGLIASAADGSPLGAGLLAEIQADIDPPTIVTSTTADIVLPVASIPVVSTAGARAADVGDPDYINVNGQIVTYTGFDGTHFTGCAGGAGAVPSGSPVSQSGAGAGKAPPGMFVLVQTTNLLAVDIVVPVRTEVGYGVASPGSADVTPFVRDALADYIAGIESGSYIIFNQVLARIVEAQGVVNAETSALLINTVNGDVLVPNSPPQKPYLRTLTLSTY